MNIILSFVASFLISNTNVVVVLDASGSMSQLLESGESRMDAAKTSLCQTIDNLNENTEFGICVFSAWNTPDWIHPISKIKDKQNLKQVVNSIQESAGTPLGEYIKIAADQLLAKRNKDKIGIYKLLLITDGEAGDQHLVDKYIPDVMNRGILVNVIGIGMDSSHSLAKKVHSYVDVNDTNSLKKAISDALGEVSFNDSNSEDYFEITKNLDMPTSLEIINNFSKISNHPIGEEESKVIPTLITFQEEQVSKNNSFNILATIILSVIFIVIFIISISLIAQFFLRD